MNIIFLDIDGVLNNTQTTDKLRDGFTGVDTRLRDLFLDWIKGRKISIVLSSSWRTQLGYKEHLAAQGITWIAQTPEASSRGEEIQEVLDSLPVDQYAILDDFGPEEFLESQRPYLVRTSYRIGLTKTSLSKVATVLSKPYRHSVISGAR